MDAYRLLANACYAEAMTDEKKIDSLFALYTEWDPAAECRGSAEQHTAFERFPETSD